MTPANFEQLLSKDKLYLLLKEAGCLYSYLHNQGAHVYFAQGVDSGESLAMSPILDAVVKTVCNACPKNSDQGVARYSIDGCFSLKQVRINSLTRIDLERFLQYSTSLEQTPPPLC